MAAEDNEEERLRSVALQNAQSILAARRRAEEALRKQSEWLRVTLSSIGDAVISTDGEGEVTFLNGVAESLTGWPKEEALGRPLQDVFRIINQQTCQPVDNPVERVLREGNVVGLANHTILIARDGTERRIDDSAAPIRDDAGRVIGVVLVFHDITGRKQAEDARAHLAAIVESSDDAIISKNLQGVITTWNRGAEKLFGYTAAEAVGQPITMLIPPQHVHEEPQILEKIRRGETIAHYETVRRRKDGTAIDISLTVSPIRDEAGNIIGASKIARDITERQQARKALHKSEERYRSLTSILTSVVWTTDAEGAFVVPQPEWEAFTGQTWEQHRDWGWANAIHPDDRERVQAAWRSTVESGSTYQSEGRIWKAASGKYHYYVARAVPLLNADGSTREWVGNILDVQERKEAEAEREQLLTAERVARETADAASRAKDEFLATVSHELRSPLNAILGWARILANKNVSDEAATRGLKAIEQNAKAQAQLIEDLLDVSRIISGKFRLNNAPIQVVRVVEAAIDSIRPTAEIKGVRLQVTLDPDAGPVLGDAGRLQQVVWNVLSNAVKFTPKDGRVQVGLLRINSHIEIVVSDTGQGIGPEFLPHVFNRFSQADGSNTRMHGGLGLGLAIVRHIVELHGGSVAADSPGKDQGATFTVRLPLMVVHTKDSIERVHPKVEAEGALHFQPSLTLEGIRVLVVDDEPETLLLLGTLLTQSGASVKTASSADDGFKEAQAWHPNVIVSDIGMPGENGYEFIKRVRAWARETGIWIPAVALTAYARAEDRMKALSSGFQIHVPKPVEPAELVMVISSLIERPTTPWNSAF